MKLELGTVQFGLDYGVNNVSGRISDIEARNIIDYAYENSILTLDTAIAYGQSEEVLGNLDVSKFKVISKIGAVGPANVKSTVENMIQSSTERLRVNKLYGLLLHRPDDLHSLYGNELYETLRKLKKEGLIEKIGVSIYTPDELDLIVNKYEIDIVQVPFNVLDQRLVVQGWLDRLSQNKIEIHVRSVFMQGLLLMNHQSRPDKFKKWSNEWNLWNNWLNRENLTALQGCLAYIKQFNQIDQIIVGVDNLNQLKAINEAFVKSYDHINFNGLPHVRDEELLNPSKWSNL
ncbi:aldo/keto reductase [Acinetobacter bereziniae]|uniref:aldo/keto reductase n=1 Tax=Acinetobacter bereziniae TaxID=106648 RepID=UPI00301A445C